MRKVVIALTILSTAIFIGCKQKTMVLNEDTQIEQSNNEYKITERIIDNPFDDMIFNPLYYGEEGVYGRLSTTRLGAIKEDELDIPYLININGEFNISDAPWLQKDSLEFNSVNDWERSYGIYTEGPYAKDTNYYYRDVEKDIKIKLDEYEEIHSYVKKEYKDMYRKGYKLGESDRYYVYIYSSIINLETESENVYTPYIDKQLAVIIDIENGKYYTIETKMDENLFVLFYYDELAQAIMVLKNDAQISKLEFNNDKISLVNYKEIDLSQYGVEINKDFTGYSSFFINDNLIFSVDSEEGSGITQVAYNVYSDDLRYIKSDKRIISDIENTDFCIVWTGAKYLGKISENGEAEILYKLNNIENFDAVTAIANKEGNRIFIKKVKYNIDSENAKNYIDNSEYSFLEIEK